LNKLAGGGQLAIKKTPNFGGQVVHKNLVFFAHFKNQINFVCNRSAVFLFFASPHFVCEMFLGRKRRRRGMEGTNINYIIL